MQNIDLETEWLRNRSEIAGLRVELSLQRLILGLRRKDYHPEQPRDDLGRWSPFGGFGLADRQRLDGVQVAQGGPDIPFGSYRIDLHDEEALGGHSITRHIGESEQSILSKLRYEIAEARTKGDKIEEARLGTFTSVEAANKLISSTLSQNPILVDQVARGDVTAVFISARFASPTGFEAYALNERSQPYIRDTYGVGIQIVHDKRSPKGFRVQTAFPLF